MLKVAADLSETDYLAELLQQSRSFDLPDCLAYLNERGRFHSTALVLSKLGRLNEAIEIWKK